jgi:threonine synthase
MRQVPTPSFSPYLAGVSCFACERPHDFRALENVCRSCGLPLRVDYQLDRIQLAPSDLADRCPSLWRYREVLPLAAGEITLVEGWTPLFEVEARIYLKDESRNPTGSFKARGMTVAVSAAVAAGAKALMAPSAGNAASALSAYGAAAGLPVTVAMPADTPRIFIEECRHFGAQVQLVPGTIADAGRWLRENGPPGAFDVSTLKEPYRVEGKKTMAYELWEQLGQRLPHVIVYPTGGGTGLIGMWKAFQEMEALGWPMPVRPRLVCVQPEGCAPVSRAFHAGEATTTAWPDPFTAAFGLRVPSPIGGFLCLRALRETGGTAVVVPESAIAAASARLAARTGLDICPEGGAAWAATEQLRDQGFIRPHEHVALFNTGTGLKYR